MKLLTRLGIAVGGIAVAVSVATATPAAADAGSTCVGNGNVWVVVQSPAGTSTGCASSFGTGEQALRSAGMSMNYNSSGMICQINGYPQICEESPMPYWAYFHAPAGGSWGYANFGAANRTPPAGSAEGWRFGTGEAPGVRVPDMPARPAPPPTTAAATSAPPTRSAPSTAPSTTAARPTTSKPRTPASEPARPKASMSPTGRTQPTRTASPRAHSSVAESESAPASATTTPTPTPSAEPTPTVTPATARSFEPTAQPPVATVVDTGSSNGLLITGGAVGVAALGAGSVLWLRSRNGAA